MAVLALITKAATLATALYPLCFDPGSQTLCHSTRLKTFLGLNNPFPDL